MLPCCCPGVWPGLGMFIVPSLGHVALLLSRCMAWSMHVYSTIPRTCAIAVVQVDGLVYALTVIKIFSWFHSVTSFFLFLIFPTVFTYCFEVRALHSWCDCFFLFFFKVYFVFF